jgi:hypothetical protein
LSDLKFIMRLELAPTFGKPSVGRHSHIYLPKLQRRLIRPLAHDFFTEEIPRRRLINPIPLTCRRQN